LLLFLITLRTPLTGRMQLQTANVRWIRRARNGFVLLLLVVFGATAVFSGTEPLYKLRTLSMWKNSCHYAISSEQDNAIISTAQEKQVEALSGADYALCISELQIGLSFPGKEEITPYMEVLKEADWWDEMFDFGAEREAFWNGEVVLLCFPDENYAEQNAGRIFQETGEQQTGNWLLPDGTITLRAYSSAGELLAESTAVASIRYDVDSPSAHRTIAIHASYPYTVVCSDAYFQRFLATMDAGVRWNGYGSDAEYGHTDMEIRLEPYAMSNAVDNMVAKFCKENQLTLYNYKEKVSTNEQLQTQEVLLLCFSGGCILIAVLLILSAELSLEAEQERRSFRVLRAIGMSARQMKRVVCFKALRRGLFTFVAGWMIYLIYESRILVQKAVEVGVDRSFNDAFGMMCRLSFYSNHSVYAFYTPVFILTDLLCLFVPLVLTLLAKRNLWKGDLEL
jgi:hypothetical protein